MIIVLYLFEVDEEQKEAYIKVTKEKIKPFWEEKGCKYEIYKETEGSSFLKIMTFPDHSSLKRVLFEKDVETERIIELFKGFAKNVKRSIYERVI